MVMHKIITAEEAVKLNNPIFIDVRSESEFQETSYPGAINLPVLNDEERARVGTVYRHESPQAARFLALEFMAPKLPGLIKEIYHYSLNGEVVLFCWRGGSRSLSIASVCDVMGIFVYRLAGGIKGYRKFINNYLNDFEIIPQVVVLHGLTGVGKTEMLTTLNNLGVSTIDLEELAHNRGSVFGSIGMGPPPSQKSFEAGLVQYLIKYRNQSYIVVECESKRIGRNVIPEKFFTAMKNGRHLLLYDTVDNRVQRLIKIYAQENRKNHPELKSAINALERKLGKKKVSVLNEQIQNEDYETVVKTLLLEYYDPLYNYPDCASLDYEFCIDAADIHLAAGKVKSYLDSVCLAGQND